MFIAMNRFKVKKGSEYDFEQIWLTRETHLEGVPGFIAFQLLKGPERDDYVLYASHSQWRSEENCIAWTNSDALRKAHAGAYAMRERASVTCRYSDSFEQYPLALALDV